jgi:prepilin-type processing-associated H-X9-DG protein
VVIAIISILTALLAPSLKKARDSAKSITCMNNLRQIGIAETSYSSDNEGLFVPNRLDDPDPTFWCQRLLPYLGQNKVSWPSAPYAPVFWCPSATQSTVQDPLNGYESTYLTKLSYGQNIYLGGWPPGMPGHRQVEVQKTSRMVLVTDANFAAIDSGPTTTSFRHDNQINILFVDGHIEKSQAPINTVGGKYNWIIGSENN